MFNIRQVFVAVVFSKNGMIKEMWPEGALSVTSITKRPVTAGVDFKNSIIQLVEKNLSQKVSTKHIRAQRHNVFFNNIDISMY